MSKSSKKMLIQMPSVAEDRKITAAAKADPDGRPLTNAQLDQMEKLSARAKDIIRDNAKRAFDEVDAESEKRAAQ